MATSGLFDDLSPGAGEQTGSQRTVTSWLFDDMMEPTSAAQPEQPTLAGEFGKGVMGGLKGLQQAGYGVSALAGEGLKKLGAEQTGESLAQWGLQGAQQTAQEAQQYAPAISSIGDIGSGRDAALWAAQGLGQLVPFAASSIAGGGVGGVAGRALAGAAAKQATERAIASGVGKLAAEEAGKAALKTGIERGTLAGLAATNIPTEQGLIYTDTAQQTGERAPGEALGYGALAGALDIIPEMRAAKRVIAPAVRSTLGREIGKQVLSEGVTEGAQTYIENLPIASRVPEKAAGWEEILNAAALGALGGGVIGGGAEVAGRAFGDDLVKQQQQRNALLEDADTPAQVREAISQEIAQEIASQDPQAASNFYLRASDAIARQEPLVIDPSLFEPVAPRTAGQSPSPSPLGGIESPQEAQAGRPESLLPDVGQVAQSPSTLQEAVAQSASIAPRVTQAVAQQQPATDESDLRSAAVHAGIQPAPDTNQLEPDINRSEAIMPHDLEATNTDAGQGQESSAQLPFVEWLTVAHPEYQSLGAVPKDEKRAVFKEYQQYKANPSLLEVSQDEKAKQTSQENVSQGQADDAAGRNADDEARRTGQAQERVLSNAPAIRGDQEIPGAARTAEEAGARTGSQDLRGSGQGQASPQPAGEGAKGLTPPATAPSLPIRQAAEGFAPGVIKSYDAGEGTSFHVVKSGDGYAVGLYDNDSGEYARFLSQFKGPNALDKALARAERDQAKALKLAGGRPVALPTEGNAAGGNPAEERVATPASTAGPITFRGWYESTQGQPFSSYKAVPSNQKKALQAQFKSAKAAPAVGGLKPAQRKAVAKPQVEKTDPILTAISKLGGLSRTDAEAQGIDPAEFRRLGHGIKRVFTKNGKSFDAMAESLHELGYPVADELGNYSANALLGKVSDALLGKTVRTPEGAVAAAEAGNLMAEDAYDPGQDEDSRAALEVALLIDEIQPGKGRELLQFASRNGYDIATTLDLLQGNLDDIRTEEARQASTPGTQAVQQVEGQRQTPTVDTSGQKAPGGRGSAAKEQGLTLTGQTEAEIRAEEENQKATEKAKAEADKKAEAKAAADRERADFELSPQGSGSKEKDQLSARVVDLFGGKARFSRAQAGKPEDFVTTADGGIDYGNIDAEIAKAIKRQAGPIRLRVGDEKSGAAHINRPDRLKQLDNAGFASAEDLISDLAKNYTAIYQGRGRSLLLAKRNGRGVMAYIQLEPSDRGDYYDVKSALVTRDDFFKNKTPLWERAQTNRTVSGPPSAVSGQSGANESIDPNDKRRYSRSADTDQAMQSDMAAQAEFLTEQAKQAGHQSVAEFLQDNPQAFFAAAAQWRAEHPAQFSRKSSQERPGAITRAQGNRLVQAFRAVYRGSVPLPIKLYDTQADFLKAHGMNPEGAGRISAAILYGNREVGMVLENISGPQRFYEKLRHEVFGHYGVARILGKDFDRVMDLIYKGADSDKALGALRDEVLRQQGKWIANDKQALAEEMIALAAEYRLDSPLLRRILGAIRAALRKIGLVMGDMTLDEVRDLIARSASNLRKPQYRTGFRMAARYSRESAPGIELAEPTDADWEEFNRLMAVQQQAVPATASTSTPEFKAYFKGAHDLVKNTDGSPKVLYHGTPGDITAFDVGKTIEGVFYLTDSPQVAETYAGDVSLRRRPNIMPMYAALKNPLVVDFKGAEHSYKRIRNLLLKARAEGRDGIIIENIVDDVLPWQFGVGPATDYIVFDPKALKSAVGNVGAYGQRPVTAEEAGRMGMTEAQASAAQRAGDIRFSRTQEDTPEFKRWFGKSAALQEDGKPLLLYHHSPRSGDILHPGGLSPSEFISRMQVAPRRIQNQQGVYRNGPGIWLTPQRWGAPSGRPEVLDRTLDNIDKAYRDWNDYADGKAAELSELAKKHFGSAALPSQTDYQAKRDLAIGSVDAPHVIPVYARIENPLYIRTLAERSRWLDRLPSGHMYESGFPWSFSARQRDALRMLGYDGIIVDIRGEAEENGTEYIAFSSNQIKSAIGNRGTFSPDNPDIRFSRTASDIKDSLTNYFMDRFGPESKITTVNWLNKTLNTPYHLAQKFPEFKPVFDRAMDYQFDVNRLAQQSEQIANDVFRRLESFREAIPGLAKTGTASDADLKATADAVLAGTHVDEKIYSDQELRDGLKLTDRQIRLYRQIIASAHDSVDELAKSTIARVARTAGLERSDIAHARTFGSLDDFAAALSDALEAKRDDTKFAAENAKDEKDRKSADAKAKQLSDAMESIDAVMARNKKLKNQGYFPLMRFGQYTVDAVDADGERLYFGMFESKADAVAMRRALQQAYPGAKVEAGTMNDEEFKLFQGIDLNAMELFMKEAGLDTDPVVQEYLKRMAHNNNAMSRLIHRKNIPGFNRDVRRVLAQFITSNARMASRNYHMGDMLQAVRDIPKIKGDLAKQAGRLYEYLNNPQEEFQGLRGFLFFNYLGGSVASALVNLTQIPMVTLPWLNQHVSVAKATSTLLKWYAAKPTAPDHIKALQRARDEGVIEPQEIYNLMAAAQGGRGAVGKITGSKPYQSAMYLWGGLFSLAEKANRYVAFNAAYEIAKEKGIKDPYEFARNAVDETQFIYAKSNRPVLGRGIGAPMFCVDEATECLTAEGWKTIDEIRDGEIIASFDMTTERLSWVPTAAVYRAPYDGEMVHVVDRNLDMLMTPDHRVVTYRRRRTPGERSTNGYHFNLELQEARDLNSRDTIPTAAIFDHRPIGEPIPDELIPVLGWIITEGCFYPQGYITIYQNEGQKAEAIREALQKAEIPWTESSHRFENGNAPHIRFFIRASRANDIRGLLPSKQLTPQLLMRLTKEQIKILVDVMIAGDGHTSKDGQRGFFQNPGITLDTFQMALTILGLSYTVRRKAGKTLAVLIRQGERYTMKRTKPKRIAYQGRIWSPQVPGTGTWIARRNGKPFITHNTFKQYTISYLELLSRLPMKQRALALAMLTLAAGASGLPGEDDLFDLLDTLAQWIPGADKIFSTNNKRAMQDWAVKELGPYADYFMKGVTAGMPIDAAGRLGLENILPGSAIMKQSETDRSRDVTEAVGPVGGVIRNLSYAAGSAAQGDIGRAAYTVLPNAIKAMVQAAIMATTGQYLDARGKPVMPVDKGDAFAKFFGFQPAKVAEFQERKYLLQQDVNLQRVKEQGLVDRWARAIVDRQPKEIAEVRKEQMEWNRDHPDMRVIITAQQLRRRVVELKRPSEQRFLRAAPPEMRQAVRGGLAE